MTPFKPIVHLPLLLPLLLVFLPAVATPAAAPESAESIVRSLAQKYAAMTSYQDEGEVSTTYGEAGKGSKSTTRFTTWFHRPDRLRFEWRDDERRGRIWSDGQAAYSWYSAYGFSDPAPKEESLALAIGRATGVSSGTAYTVPTLLLPKAAVFRLDQLEEMRVVRVESLEGSECFVITGEHPRGDRSYTLWIGTEDRLLRRIRKVGENAVTDEVRRRIQIDRPVPEEIFTDPSLHTGSGR